MQPTTPNVIRPQEMPAREREQSPFTFFDQTFEDYFDLGATFTPTIMGGGHR